MNLKVVLLLLSSYIIFIYGNKSCGEQVSDFLNCFDNQRKEQEASKPKPIEFDEFQKRISSCFTSNGCKAVQLESEESIQKRHNAPPSVLVLDHLSDCEHKTAQIARASVEKCVAKKFPGFVFPPPVTPRKKGVGRPLTISWAAQALLELRDIATCPSSANVTQVETCLDKTFDEVDETKKESNPFESLLDYEGRVNKFCKADCFSKVSSDCKNSLNETFPTICDCVSNDFVENIAKYDNSFQDCIGPEALKNTNYQKNITVRAVRIKLSEEVCDRLPENPCAKSFVEIIKTSKAQGGSSKGGSAKEGKGSKRRR